MSKLVHVMVDLETLGIGPEAKILSIGAVVFCPARGLGDEFYAEIKPTSSIGKLEVGTVKFWMEQAARGNPPPMSGTLSVWETIGQFHQFLHRVSETSPENLRIWANGTDFDLPKLYYTFEETGLPVPWKYNDVRDCRTIFKLFSGFGLKPAENLAKHNALADAKWQAKYLMSLLNVLKEKGVPLNEFSRN